MSEQSDSGSEQPAEIGPGRRILRWIAVLAVAAFIVGFAVSSLLMRFGASGRTIATVPDLDGLPLAQARGVVEESGLVLDAADSLPQPRVAVGRVLTQSPLPGQEVAPGTAVQVIVSSGPQRHAVPQVAGLSRERAEQVLRATGLNPTLVEVTDHRRAGLVVETIPAAGTVVAVPAAIRVRVSTGPPMVAVPDLLGLHEQELQDSLASADLRLGELRRELRLLTMDGEVVAQQPAAGDSVPAGSGVDVIVATQNLEITPSEGFR